MSDSPLFGLLPAGQPLLTQPASQPSPSSFLYHLPTTKPFSHITAFLLPNVNLPSSTAAAIYITTAADISNAAQSGQNPKFTFLGAIGPGKESAVFKVDFGHNRGQGEGLVVGIEVEAESDVGQKLQELQAKRGNTSEGGARKPSTAILAQRIIQNAFNFLSGFSGQLGPGGVEVVPLKAFEEWWKKFESRVRADPSFLEKQSD